MISGMVGGNELQRQPKIRGEGADWVETEDSEEYEREKNALGDGWMDGCAGE